MELPPTEYTILALETSCDETAAAIVRGGTEIIANVIASQLDEHRRYGGIVPEVASRQHILALPAVIDEALAQLSAGWDGIDAVAATYGPGLSGALLTGLNAAKGLAWGRELPFIGVNHIEAHMYANWLGTKNQEPRTENQEPPQGDKETSRQGDKQDSAPQFPRSAVPFSPSSSIKHQASSINPPGFPLIALVVSGGHTMLVLLEGHGSYRVLGQTRDDAAGEAFDKVARIMGLGFPGGPAVQQVAAGTHGGMTLPRAWLRDSYDFSFSGLKTAVLHQVQGRAEREGKLAPRAGDKQPSSQADTVVAPDRFTMQLAHAFQESVVDVLVTKAINAAKQFSATEILLAGGVAANTRLREEMARRAPVPVRFPPIVLCTDNAAMVAAAAYYRFGAGLQSTWDLDVQPNLRIA